MYDRNNVLKIIVEVLLMLVHVSYAKIENSKKRVNWMSVLVHLIIIAY